MMGAPTLRLGLTWTAILLVGCGPLLGGGDKADLYRFGNTLAASPTGEPRAVAAPVAIAYPGSTFQPSIAGERILTVNGTEVAYIARPPASFRAMIPDRLNISSPSTFGISKPAMRAAWRRRPTL